MSRSTQFTVVKEWKELLYEFCHISYISGWTAAFKFCCLTFRFLSYQQSWPLARYSLVAVSPLIPSVAHSVRFMVYVRLIRRTLYRRYEHCCLFARHLHSDACSKQQKIWNESFSAKHKIPLLSLGAARRDDWPYFRSTYIFDCSAGAWVRWCVQHANDPNVLLAAPFSHGRTAANANEIEQHSVQTGGCTCTCIGDQWPSQLNYLCGSFVERVVGWKSADTDRAAIVAKHNRAIRVYPAKRIAHKLINLNFKVK